MRALQSIEQERTQDTTARRDSRRQAARTMAEENTQLRMVASIPARRIPITATVTIPTGKPAIVTAFTNPAEVLARIVAQ